MVSGTTSWSSSPAVRRVARSPVVAATAASSDVNRNGVCSACIVVTSYASQARAWTTAMSMSPVWTPSMFTPSPSDVSKIGRTVTEPPVRFSSSDANVVMALPSGLSAASTLATRMTMGLLDAAALGDATAAAVGEALGDATPPWAQRWRRRGRRRSGAAACGECPGQRTVITDAIGVHVRDVVSPSPTALREASTIIDAPGRRSRTPVDADASSSLGPSRRPLFRFRPTQTSRMKMEHPGVRAETLQEYGRRASRRRRGCRTSWWSGRSTETSRRSRR